MTADNEPPEHIWETLRRLLACNKSQLAKRLGISTETLRRWTAETEAGKSPGKDAEARAAELLQTTLAIAKSDVHAQWRINWNAISTIEGRK